MTRGQLIAVCRLLDLTPIGTNAFLRFQIEMQMRKWIELSTNEKVPPSLLLLSRTLYLPEHLAPEKAIEATISALPETVATGAKAKIGEREGKIENVTRLEIIKQEQAKIEEEEKELERSLAEKKKKAE